MGHARLAGTSRSFRRHWPWITAIVLIVGCDSKPKDGNTYITREDESRHRELGLGDGRRDVQAGESYDIHRTGRPEANLSSVRVRSADGGVSFDNEGLNPYERGYRTGYSEGAREKVRGTSEWKGGLFSTGLEAKEKAGAVLEVTVKPGYPPCKVVVWLKTEANRGYSYEFDVKTLKIVNLQENVGLAKSYGIEVVKPK